jgi:hypothetical protein
MGFGRDTDGTTGYGCTAWGRISLVRGAILRVQGGPKVDNGGEGAVAIVHRRVQLLVGHLDRSGLFGGGSTVARGGSGDRFRLHLVACARTRSARDGRWPSLPWGGRGCIAQGTREAHRENASREGAAGQVGAGHTKQRRDLGETDAGGAGSTVQSAGATGGPSEATARQGRAASSPP